MILQDTELLSFLSSVFREAAAVRRVIGKESGSICWTESKGGIFNQSQRELVVQSANQN